MKFSPAHSAAHTPPGRRLRAKPGWFCVFLFGLVLQVWQLTSAFAAVPLFENRTPVGFSRQDSTTREDFVEGQEVTVRVDLNQAATPTYPVIGHFHNLETSKTLESEDVDGLRADVAVSSDGIIHTAWIAQGVVSPVTTPVYHVRYARSADQGKTFTSPVSVSGTLRFDILTLDGSGTSFSTLDLEVDSRGNPRIAYAFNHSADGKTAGFSSNPNNVYFNYSEDAGASWLPGNTAVIVNDVATLAGEGLDTAFPRMVIDQRDNIFISYVRGTTKGTGADDVMLARVNRATSPFTMDEIGPGGTSGSSGGVRISPDGGRETGPDISLGSGDVLHLIYFNDTDDDIEHKTLLADSWTQAGSTGWNQTLDGADVDDFVNTASAVAGDGLETDAVFYFPTVVVDRQSSPNKVYALYKFGDATFETIFFNNYVYDNAIGANAGWNTGSAAPVWSTANTSVFSDGNSNYNVELDWTVTERVGALVDDRLASRGELHIVFSAGHSSETAADPHEHDIYYGYYNGTSWTLPEIVADDDSDVTGTTGIEDGIASGDVFLSAPAIAKGTGEANLYMVFAGGANEGMGVDFISDVNQHAYFKVLGRVLTSEDESVPVGGFAYNLSYAPINPHSISSEITNNMVMVHVADNSSGDALGAKAKTEDGFLAGDWETVGATLADDDKFFEGRINEDTSSTHEWGDDDDKVDLLVKLNVLGSDSSTNVQEITNSTASAVGTGKGARSIRVGTDPRGSFVVANSFFLLGADIDIIDSNTAPFVSIQQPDGIADTANTHYIINYDLSDADDDISASGLKPSLYASRDSTLSTVQEIRIFGTLIANENDRSSVSADGTDDFLAGTSQTYTWDDPPSGLKNLLFASIQQIPSGNYYIYLVADDQKNPPVFARSPGALSIIHKPIVDQVDPIAADTVDTGVRTGELANPYDLDFAVRDFDLHGTAEVQLFFSAVSGLNSLSVAGTFPNQKFALGKSVAGTRATAITNSDTLTSADREFSWDVQDSVFVNGDSTTVAEGAYFIYLVASDSENNVVGQSSAQLSVKHSPSFTFYEPPRDTHRRINSRSQPVYTIQWQKGRGDRDFDDNAVIDLYFSTDNPAIINYEDFPDSLLKDADTRVIVKGLSEDGDNASDMYVWDFRTPPNDVPKASIDGKVWLYAIISDAKGNSQVALGGALSLTHEPHITLLSSDLDDYSGFEKNDMLRLSWDDYLVDDGSGTDDGYIRLYASPPLTTFSTLAQLEADVLAGNSFLVNSSDGTLTGTIQTIREDSSNFFDWNTRLFGTDGSTYHVYAGISSDETFSNNSATTLSKSTSVLSIDGITTLPKNITTMPSQQTVAIGDTLTMDVMVYHPQQINLVQIVLNVGSGNFSVVDQGSAAGTQPFIDANSIFSGTNPIENTVDNSNNLRFSKSSFVGEVVGTQTQPDRLARFQLVALESLEASPSVVFSQYETGTVLGLVGRSDPLDNSNDGLSLDNPVLTRVRRGFINVASLVKLEGRTLGDGDHSTLLDVHLRRPGSTIDLLEEKFRTANDDLTSTTDTIEVTTNSSGALTLVSVPAGRYVLTVKDTSHVSGRTDTFTIRNGDDLTIGTDIAGLFGSDLRGDPTSVLPTSGTQLIAGDASQDNEINEDDVNVIIAAWSTSSTAANFKAQADINNDDEVGAVDLTVTTSNFGNSEGFGAPPVFKPLVEGDNRDAFLEIRPLFDGRRPLVGGQLIDLEVKALELNDLAGYEFDLHFDSRILRLVVEEVESGEIFSGNPHGSVFETRVQDGQLSVIGSRIGKVWSAQGEGSLARLRFEVLQGGGTAELAAAINIGEGILLDTAYRQEAVNWRQSLAELLLPSRPDLEQNYPNPFNPTTVIPFALPAGKEVDLAIYNVLGQKIRTLVKGPIAAGYHTLIWNGRNDAGHQVSSGVYFYLLETGQFRQTRKMLLVK